MKRIARWSAIFLLLCSIIWAGTASAVMFERSNMNALETLNTINKNRTPPDKGSALERLAQEIGAGAWENTDWDDPNFQDAVKNLGITVVKKDEQPPESFIGDAIFDHLGDTNFDVPEIDGNLLILGGMDGSIPSGKIDRLYVLSDEDIRLNIGAATEIQELILAVSADVELAGEGSVGSTIVLDTPKNLGIGMATNLINLSDDPLPMGDIVLNPGKNVLVPNQQIDMGDELKVEKKISLTVRFRLVDQSARDMQLETADWDGALLTEATVQYTGDSCPMGAVNMMDSIEAAFREKYPDLQEQYVLLPEMRSADPWSKVYRLTNGESCFATTENDVYLSLTGDVVFPLTDESTLVAEFPVYVYRFGEQDGRITYRLRISGARPDYFTPSLTLRSGAKAEFTFDKESNEWVTSLRRSDFGENERDRIHLTGLRGEETDAFLTVTGREEQRIVTLTWTADTQRVTIDAQNVLWESDMPADGNDLLCKAGEQVTVRIAPAAGYRGINIAMSDPAISFTVSEENDAISFLMPYAPLTLTLTANQIYTVTLDTNGGEALTPLNYTVAESLTLPMLNREGYTFLGWTGEGIDTPQVAVEIPVGSTGHRNYKANWQTIPYIITFDTNGGEPLDAISYTVEDEITLPMPTRTGYDFAGWTGEGIIAPQTSVIIPKGTTGDRTYIANWTLTEYTITFDTAEGAPIQPIRYTVTSEPIPLPTPVRTGYRFVGWTGEDISEAQAEVIIPTGSTGDRTYTANWQTIPYIITFDTNGGEPLDAITYTVEDEITLPIPVRAGYDFVGWTDEENGEMQNATIPKGTMGDKMYIAGWKAKEYTITLETNGGDPIPTIRYTVEDEITLPKPIRTGYLFVGWTGEGISEAQENVVIPRGSMGDRTYTANWQIIEYTITMLETAGAGTSEKMTYTVETAVTLPTPTREGYTFVGWTGNGETTTQKTIVLPKGTTGDKTYTANWETIEYTITLGTSGGDPLDSISYTVESEPITLPTPERKGYEFRGWIGDDIDGMKTEVIIPTGSTGDRAYIATWRIIEYVIELRQSSGDWMQNIVYTVEKEVTLPIPSRDGYEFIGWVGEDIIDAQIKVTIPRGSMGFKRYAAHWAMENYTITLDTNGGEALDDISYKVTDASFDLPTPERKGYEFKGWTGEGISEPQTKVTIPKGTTGDKAYTANWELETYTIEIWYCLNDVGRAEYLYNVPYTMETPDFYLEKPTIDGYQFVGWEDDAWGIKYAEVFIPHGSTKLEQGKYTACFTKLYTITLDTNGGDAIDSISYTMESDAFDLPTPTREGYTFTGWTGEGITTPQKNVTIPKYSVGDRTYTANWELITYRIGISYYTEDGDGGQLPDVTYTVETPDFDLPKPNVDGYQFLGWGDDDWVIKYTNVRISRGSTEPEVKAYTAYFTKLYTITLDTNGGETLASIQYTLWSDSFNLPTPTRDGYTFTGWTQNGTSGEPQMTVTISQYSTGDRTYTAHWEPTEYTITLDLNGGSGEEKVQYTAEDEDFDLPTPTREGYTFTGWTGEGITTPQTKVNIPTGSTGDKTYTANWEAIEYCIVLLNYKGQIEKAITYTIETGATISAPSYTLDGCIFMGWSILDGSDYSLEIILPPGTTGNRVYAQRWELIEYTITLNTNGGNALAPIQYVVWQSAFTLPTPTRTGYKFTGWTGEGISEPQTKVTIPEGSTGNRTYTANWQAIVYTITFDTNGGKTLGNITYTVEDDAFDLPTPTREGYTFIGWSGPGFDGAQTKVTIEHGSMGDRVYAANWKVNTYTITLDTNGGEKLDDITYTMEDEITLPTPTREGYDFKGWTGMGITTPQTKVTIPKGSMGNKTYTANWEGKKYYVKIVCYDEISGRIFEVTVEYTPGTPLPIQKIDGYEFLYFYYEIPYVTSISQDVFDRLGDTITCDALYTPQFTITLDTNGGDPLSPIRFSVYTEPFTLPTPTREGYEFWGWQSVEIGFAEPHKSATIYPSESRYQSNITFTAKWLEIHNITLDTNGGDPLAPLQYKYSAETPQYYTYFMEPVTLPNPTREGYDFVGWTGEGISTPTKNLTVPGDSKGDLTYTANWKLVCYTITLDAYGDGQDVIIPYTVTSDPITLPTPTRMGYMFLGWTGGGITEPQTTVTIPTGSTGDRMYTAHWYQY